MNFTPAPAQPRRKARARTGAMTQPPPPVFEIPTRNRFAALCETECNAVVIGDSIVRNVPAILKDDANVGAVVLHAGVNDVRMRQSEILKRDFRSLIETVRNASPTARIIVSGPLPTYRRGNEKFSRLFALNKWLMSWCIEQKLLFVDNFDLFWERPRLFRPDGLHPSSIGAVLLSDNISKTLRTACLRLPAVSQNFNHSLCSSHSSVRNVTASKCIETVSVPRIILQNNKIAKSQRKNLIVIKPEDNVINDQNKLIKFGLLNIRSLNSKAVIVNEMITDNSFDILCLNETWLKPNDYYGLNECTPPSYCYMHEPRPVGRGGGVATIF
ncbi:uncharacterized protein LOC130551130 [Triplophysa rosa]|uniref:uncharacterized protein LOC130551130 n=2 Tax=Triplophysa rosa TaxID=992332 RepID=UPI002545F338|nr:uncharacterized protein LOC130551130 [Triplophysa rosa]